MTQIKQNVKYITNKQILHFLTRFNNELLE